MITSLTKMLELTNFSQSPHLQYNLNHVINIFGDAIVKDYDVITLISKYLYFKKAWSSQFYWHQLNCNRIYQKIFKDSKKVKRITNFYQNAIYVCIFWYNKICWFLIKKCWCQQNSRGVSGWLISFGGLL